MSTQATERTRVLILIKGLGIGGAEMLISESAGLWDRESFEYRVAYLLPWKDQLVAQLTDEGVEVTCLEWRGPPGLKAISRLRRLSRTWQPHLVHSHLPAAAVIARLTLPGRAHVYTEHNIVSSYRQPTRWLNRATYAQNRAVIAVSDAVAQSIDGYPGPEPTVIPNGVSVQVSDDEVSRARSELGITRETPLVVHVGNIRPHKGHTTLIDATKILLEDIPEALTVSIGGEKHDGDLERVRTAAEASGITASLRFLGRRDDARSFLAAADVVVNPADVEGLPVALLEAMALGRPVVATSVGGVPSVVQHERSGLLVPPGDPRSLAAALARALRSPRASIWGEEGARTIEQTHGLDRMVSSYEDLYRVVVNG